jgi:hypothetical protein
VLRIVASVPAGHITTAADVGAHLRTKPRSVAYLLATLAGDGRITGFVARRIEVASLPDGVAKQARPAEAPPARRRR